MTCYVYLWFRPNGTPLYVGWGTHRRAGRRPRWADHIEGAVNQHLRAAFKKYGVGLPLVILRDGLNHKEAKLIERAFIAAIGRADLNLGPLANQTDGGEGLTNASAETRAKIGTAHRGRKNGPCRPETKLKISAANRGKVRSQAAKDAVSKALRGRIRSPEFKLKVSKGMTRRCEEYGGQTSGRKLRPEHRAKITEARRGFHHSVATRKNLSAIVTARMQDKGQRAVLSERATAAWANPIVRERQVAAIRVAAARKRAAKAADAEAAR